MTIYSRLRSANPLKSFKKAAGLIIHGHNIMLQMSQVLLLGAEHVNSHNKRWVEPPEPKESDVDEEEDEILARLLAEGKDREAASRRRHILCAYKPSFHSDMLTGAT